MKRKNSVLALATLPLLVAWALPEGGVRFAPQPGTSVTKTISFVMKTSLDEMEMTMNGEDFPQKPEIESSSTVSRTLVVTDTYTKSEGGRPLVLEREYSELTMTNDNPIEINMMGQDMSADLHATGTSELEGTTVKFEWDADEEEYRASFVGEGGDEEMLAGLGEDLDVRALLPVDEVEVGDSWDLDTAALVSVFFPGGELSFEFESDGDEPMMGMSDPSQNPDPAIMMGEPEGSASATFETEREADGVRVAEISIDFQLDSSTDLTEYISEMLSESMPEMPMVVESADAEWTFEGSGVLLWNLDGGHVHSLELEGQVTTLNEQEMSVDAQGQSMSIGQVIDSSGTLKVSVATAPGK